MNFYNFWLILFNSLILTDSEIEIQNSDEALELSTEEKENPSGNNQGI